MELLLVGFQVVDAVRHLTGIAIAKSSFPSGNKPPQETPNNYTIEFNKNSMALGFTAEELLEKEKLNSGFQAEIWDRSRFSSGRLII